MENSIYHENGVFHVVTVWNDSKGFVRYNFYMEKKGKAWKCIVETNIPNDLVLADSLK